MGQKKFDWVDLIDPVMGIQIAVDILDLKYGKFLDENAKKEFLKINRALEKIHVVFEELHRQRQNDMLS